jgi:hypothetical protein
VAVENDYNLLVFWVNNLAETAAMLRAEVQLDLLREAEEGLEPNETRWVQTIVTRLPLISGPATQLEHEAGRVLRSRPGEAVFDAQPPEIPDAITGDPTEAARQFWDAMALTTEHADIDRVEAFRRMCEAAIKAYDGTEDQRIADWAREALRLLDESGEQAD